MISSSKTAQAITAQVRIPPFEPSRLRQWQESVVHAAQILDVTHLLSTKTTFKSRETKQTQKDDFSLQDVTKTNTNNNENIPPDSDSSSTTTKPSKIIDFTIDDLNDTLASKLTTTDHSNKLLSSLLHEYIFFIDGIQETKTQRTERLFFYQLMYHSVKNYQYLTVNIKTGDVKGLWSRVGTIGQPNTVTILQQSTRKLVNHHKTNTYPFHNWYITFTKICDDLQMTGMTMNENTRIAHLMSLLQYDHRYKSIIRHIELNNISKESDIVLLIAQHAAEIKDDTHHMKSTHHQHRKNFHGQRRQSTQYGNKSFNNSQNRPMNHSINLSRSNIAKLSKTSKQSLHHQLPASHSKHNTNKYFKPHTANFSKDNNQNKYKNKHHSSYNKNNNTNTYTSYKDKHKTPTEAVCFQWQQNGSCTYGDRCQFKHTNKHTNNYKQNNKHKMNLCISDMNNNNNIYTHSVNMVSHSQQNNYPYDSNLYDTPPKYSNKYKHNHKTYNIKSQNKHYKRQHKHNFIKQHHTHRKPTRTQIENIITEYHNI